MRLFRIGLSALMGMAPVVFSHVARADVQSSAAQPQTAESPAPSDQASAEASQALAAPVLVTFVQATYPPAALAEKLAADVVLELSISPEGKVVAANVQTPAGHGFDEAARDAARQFVFKPAMRNGKAIAARILYRYSFTLTAAPDTETAPPVAPKLGGHVRMAETDEALAGAKVVLRLADGRTVEVETDATGAWSAAELSAGVVQVHVEAPGFAPFEGQETVQQGESLDLIYRLRAPSDTIEVTVRGERQDREITKRTLERKELTLVPGTGGDALKVLHALPGVARPPAMSGLLIVRGSGPNGTQTFVDGTMVPNLYHFGGFVSILPTEMLEAIDFYPGNFSAKYGRVQGGIVDVRMREMKSDGKYHGLAQADFIDARLMLRGPVPLLKGWDFQLGLRRSYVDAMIAMVPQSQSGIRLAPVYYDWQGFVETKPTPTSSFRIGVFGSDDRFSVVFKDSGANDAGMGNSLTTGSSMLRAQALYKNAITDRLSVSASVATGFDTENFEFGAMRIKLDLIPVTARGEIAYKLMNGLTFRAGPDILFYRVSADVRTPVPPDLGQPDPGPYVSQPLLSLKKTANFSQPAGYAELEWQPVEQAKVTLGGRGDYFNKTEHWDFSPRLNARYDLHHDFPRTTVKGGIGMFYQPPEMIEVVEVYGSKGLVSNRSTHYSLGVEQEFSREVELSVEGFYKDLSDLVMRTPATDGSLGYKNIGDGRVIGVETLLRWKPVKRFFGWIAYTLSKSTRHNAPGEPERLFEYDQTHILSVLGSYDLGRGWQVGARFRFSSGNPFTPCLDGVLQAGAGVYSCRSGDLYSQRIPDFHQLDLRVDKTWKFTGWQLTTYLDVQNVYNRYNPEMVFYNYNYTQQRYQSLLGVLPSLGVRGEF